MEHPMNIPVYTDEELLSNCPPVEIPPPEIPVHLGDNSGSRLLISKIVCENFKSYGGKRILGPFHKNFTCIIGPNGSGKSNVIDALLFVFGFRASKVRSKKLSSLIHNSDRLPSVDFCQVSVYFQRIIDTGQGVSDYEVVAGSEFVVSRKAFKDNSNAYYINESRAGFRDVTSLLRQHGIDLDHNRFLILQGEVEQISLMKPKAATEYETGFLEYLEDIIGSSRFKKPLAILADRIERLKDIRLEKLARVKAVEKEKNELEVVRDEAMTYLRLMNKVIRVKNVIFQQNQKRELKHEAELKQQLTGVDAELEVLTARLKELNSQLSTLRTDREAQNRQASSLQERHRDAKERFARFEAEDSRVRDEHAHLKSQGKKTLKALQAERKKLEEIRSLPGEAEGRRNRLQNQLTELEQAKALHETTYKETMAILAQETEPLRKKVEAAEAALAPIQKVADEAASRLALAQQELDLAMSAYRREEERVAKAREGAAAARDRLAEREQQVLSTERQLERRSTSSADAGRRRSTTDACLREALQTSSTELAEVRAKETALVEEVGKLRSTLSEAKSSFQADNSRSRVLSSLLTAAKEGKLTGILGRLGDLGVIPQRYDVAVSTSCGALDHIVVQTMEEAQKAVEFLKANNLGQASFIGLDKMKRWEVESAKPFKGPTPSAQRLFDLVEVSQPALKPCFYFGLRNTLVAETLDVATDWAFKHPVRFRVVTLQGQLIETSGAMTGGGGRQLSGRMTTDVSRARQARRSMSESVLTEEGLSAKERQLANKEAELGQLRSKRELLEEKVTHLQRQVADAERNMAKWQAEIVRLREEAEALTREAEQAEKRAANAGPSKAEREKLEANVAALSKENTKKAAKAEKLREEVDELKTKLMEAGTARLATVRSRVALVEKKIKEVADQFTKLEVEIKTAHRNEAKTQSKIETLEKEVESLKEKLTENEAQLVEIETTAKTCMTEFQAIQQEITTLSEEREKINAQIGEVETGLAAAKKDEGVVQRKAEDLRSQAKEAAARARAWQMKLRGLRLNKVDDDDEEETPEAESADAEGDLSQSLVSGASQSQDASQHDPLSFLGSSKDTKLPTYTDEQLAEMNINEAELKKLESQIASMSPNMAAIQQYRNKVDLYLSRVAELDHVTDLRNEQLRQEAEAKGTRLSEFMAGFNVITTRLKEMYQLLTQGGDAELELIDSLDPFSEGIVFSVRPPKKTWKSIANLSGGEKTLSSLALVFALHHFRPTPLYVMDEIDAALDFKNVSIVGNYVMERTKDAQFVIISLRNNMFELADRLVGIYKTHNITKSISVDCHVLAQRLNQAVSKSKHQQQQQQRWPLAATSTSLPPPPTVGDSLSATDGAAVAAATDASVFLGPRGDVASSEAENEPPKEMEAQLLGTAEDEGVDSDTPIIELY
ncbi:Structural maintenance of chromosomes protein 4 [Sparganum proliferum]